jgi:hypothetical protein
VDPSTAFEESIPTYSDFIKRTSTTIKWLIIVETIVWLANLDSFVTVNPSFVPHYRIDFVDFINYLFPFNYL